MPTGSKPGYEPSKEIEDKVSLRVAQYGPGAETEEMTSTSKHSGPWAWRCDE
jgi:hypothetical protein